MILQETPLSGEDVSLWSDPHGHQDMAQDDLIELPNFDKEGSPVSNPPSGKSEVPTYIDYNNSFCMNMTISTLLHPINIF